MMRACMFVADLPSLGSKAIEARVARMVEASAPRREQLWVQLRGHGVPGRIMEAEARKLRARTVAAGIRLLINDRLDIALAIGADGVHIGRGSPGPQDVRRVFPSAFVSVACHSVAGACEAREAGADAIVLCPIFASPGKGVPLGVEAISETIATFASDSPRATKPKLFALGGVDVSNASRVWRSGADGVAAIRADVVEILESEEAGP